MAETRSNALGWVGIALGSISLVLALMHFYAGPFSPQPSLEETVAEKAVAIKKATIAALKGEKAEAPVNRSRFDADRIVHIAVPVFGSLAVILAVIGFATKESTRVVAGALGLGVAGIAFQFLTIALGVIVLAILIAAVLGTLGVS